MNKAFYLELSILELSKIVMYKFWHDYAKPKYRQKIKLCFMDTDSFIARVKIDHIYKIIAKNAEKSNWNNKR